MICYLRCISKRRAYFFVASLIFGLKCFKLTNVNKEQKKCSVASKEVRDGESIGRPLRIVQSGK